VADGLAGLFEPLLIFSQRFKIYFLASF